MRILVTGALGFCGSAIAIALARAGFEVAGVYRRDTPLLAMLRSEPGLRLIEADLVDARSIPGPFDAIVHTAATSPGHDVSVARIVHDNVDATFALIDAALAWQCRHFVFFSSLSIYGDFLEPIVDESTQIHNPDVYGATKFLAERRLAEVAQQLSGLALRLPGVVGWGAHRIWLSTAAARLQNGDAVGAFHLDSLFNNAVYIGDLSALIETVLRSGWGGFDAVVLGARGMTTVRAAIERLARGLDVRARIEPTTPTKASFTLSCQRAIARYGYDPMGIDDVIDRYAQDIALHTVRR